MSFWTLHLVWFIAGVAGGHGKPAIPPTVSVETIQDLGTLGRCDALSKVVIAQMDTISHNTVKGTGLCMEINPKDDVAKDPNSSKKGTTL